MAGAGYKLFVSGDVLTAAQVNTYLNEQTVMVFATSAARTSALSAVLAEGMMSYLQDSNTVYYYDGSAWNALASGDITAITAGTGISVTSGTGPVPTVAIDTTVTVDKTTAQTLTNKTLTSPALTTPTISTLTTNGDLVYGTGSGALSRLGIGSSAQVLTVASGVPSWAAAASGGSTVAVFADQKGQNTASGTFTSGAWRTRDLNTSVFNNITSCSLASNQVTLPAGTYQVIATGPAYDLNRHQMRLQNITDSSTTLVGDSNYLRSFADPSAGTANLSGAFTITGTKVFELQHQCQLTSVTNGFGVAANITTEVYAMIQITKVS